MELVANQVTELGPQGLPTVAGPLILGATLLAMRRSCGSSGSWIDSGVFPSGVFPFSLDMAFL